jgi:hypothetical protein
MSLKALDEFSLLRSSLFNGIDFTAYLNTALRAKFLSSHRLTKCFRNLVDVLPFSNVPGV